jgi:hypothetical protein
MSCNHPSFLWGPYEFAGCTVCGFVVEKDELVARDVHGDIRLIDWSAFEEVDTGNPGGYPHGND